MYTGWKPKRSCWRFVQAPVYTEYWSPLSILTARGRLTGQQPTLERFTLSTWPIPHSAVQDPSGVRGVNTELLSFYHLFSWRATLWQSLPFDKYLGLRWQLEWVEEQMLASISQHRPWTHNSLSRLNILVIGKKVKSVCILMLGRNTPAWLENSSRLLSMFAWVGDPIEPVVGTQAIQIPATPPPIIIHL